MASIIKFYFFCTILISDLLFLKVGNNNNMSTKPLFQKLKPKKLSESNSLVTKHACQVKQHLNCNEQCTNEIKFLMENQLSQNKLLNSQKIDREFQLKASTRDKKVTWRDHSTAYV